MAGSDVRMALLGVRGKHAARTHVWPRRARDGERAKQVHSDDELKLLRRHLVEGDVAEDASIVHHDIDAAPALDRIGHDPFGAVGHRIGVRHRLAARGLDRLADLGCALGDEIVDNHLGTSGGEELGILASQACTRTGDNGDAPVVANLRHVCGRARIFVPVGSRGARTTFHVL
eukprot:6385844-Prymnesium_polylepis.1